MKLDATTIVGYHVTDRGHLCPNCFSPSDNEEFDVLTEDELAGKEVFIRCDDCSKWIWTGE